MSEMIEGYNCMYQMCFLNCPVFNATEKCQETKSFVEKQTKCGEKYGENFVIDASFWNPLGFN